jgi:transposase
MPEATAVLFGIEDEFDVVSVDRIGPGQVQIIIEMRSREAACPGCGVLSGRIRDRPLCRVRDLPASGQQTQLWWRKRRLVCVRGVVSAAVVHPDQRRDPATESGDRAAPGLGRARDRRQQPGGV